MMASFLRLMDRLHRAGKRGKRKACCEASRYRWSILNAAYIWFVGDPHGDFRRVNRLACERRPAAVIFLGDLELPRSLEEVTYPMLHSKIIVRGIHGNHDADHEDLWRRIDNGPLAPELQPARPR